MTTTLDEREVVTSQKRCGRCRTFFPATAEFFGSSKGRWDGLNPYCRSCSKDAQKVYQRIGTIPRHQQSSFDDGCPHDLHPPYASRQEAELARMGIQLTATQLRLYREWVKENPTGGSAGHGTTNFSRHERDEPNQPRPLR